MDAIKPMGKEQKWSCFTFWMVFFSFSHVTSLFKCVFLCIVALSHRNDRLNKEIVLTATINTSQKENNTSGTYNGNGPTIMTVVGAFFSALSAVYLWTLSFWANVFICTFDTQNFGLNLLLEENSHDRSKVQRHLFLGIDSVSYIVWNVL